MDNRWTRQLLIGLSAGDCLGSTSEFQGPASVAKLPAHHPGWPGTQVGGGTFNWRPGEGTDDTQMALAMVKAVKQAGKWDPDAIAKAFADWYASGPKDVGGTTARACAALRDGKAWYVAGIDQWLASPHNEANGSLMRNGPVCALIDDDNLDLAFEATIQQSIMTHASPMDVLCCCAHTWMIADQLEQYEQGPLSEGTDWTDFFNADFNAAIHRTEDPHVRQWFERVNGKPLDEAGQRLIGADWDPDSFDPFTLDYAGRSGHSLLTLQIAVWALHWADCTRGGNEGLFPAPKGLPPDPFVKGGPDGVLGWVAMIGRDSDTYGAVAGALIAAMEPIEGKPITQGLEVIKALDELGITDEADGLEKAVEVDPPFGIHE